MKIAKSDVSHKVNAKSPAL